MMATTSPLTLTSRPALVAGMAITAVSSVAFAAARNVGWLFAGEIIYGVAAGLVMSATTVTIRELHPKQRAGSGALAAMVAVAAGLTLGPLVSGVLATVSPSPTVAPFLLDIVLAVALALALLRIPETDLPALATRFARRRSMFRRRSGADGRPRHWRARRAGCLWAGSFGCRRRSCTKNSGSTSPSRSSPACSLARLCSPTA